MGQHEGPGVGSGRRTWREWGEEGSKRQAVDVAAERGPGRRTSSPTCVPRGLHDVAGDDDRAPG
jgi:hypothetical protein